MASDDTMTIVSSVQEDEYDETDDGLDHDHRPPGVSLSRLSICTNEDYDNGDRDDNMRMFMSRLSMESFDADVEFSDEEDGKELLELELSSDSDKEPFGCYSLPATPPRRRNRSRMLARQLMGVDKEYASENEVLRQRVKRRRRRMGRERSVDKNRTQTGAGGGGERREGDFAVGYGNYCGSFSGESEGGGSSVVVITRPKGGRRSLCMDLEEVKACRDLGFELEHERMLEIPSRVSLSGSNLDTSSGSNSPIANWRISSPGDDPRDVKARLKVWAQAVALASASRHCS
ncbi:hypothetical protein SLEP1_g4507 [Rubroshorea leprosula]|uniref:Fold protein n=1 Tax=Rubroshorea leprosula TaxID=152421 RepID=A0AAV5HZD9_9ROSI|nr:hypothetical protein SLEP1_g4507 [Rubroshorea leprosula]